MHVESSWTCPNCGASNRAGAVRCGACGRWREDDDGTPTVIDVTSDEPVIVGLAEGDGGWRERGRGIFEYRSPDGGSRVFVSRGGVGCLVALLVPLILLCCVCVAVWQGTDWLFDVNFP